MESTLENLNLVVLTTKELQTVVGGDAPILIGGLLIGA